MLSQRVPVAVVGAGNMGSHHARNYRESRLAELVAIVDPALERAELLASRHGARAYRSLDEMLGAHPEVEAASVVTPTTLHRETAGAVLAAGRHVLVEKPIAASVEEAEELVDVAAARDLVLAVGHVERFNPAVRALKARIRAGDMGALLSLVARRVGVMPPQVRDADVIVDLAIHDLDVFRYLLDADTPEEVYCNAGKAVAQDRYDFADIFLRFGDVGCFVQVNWLTPVKIRSLAVTGTEGYAELEYVTRRLDFYSAQPVRPAESFAEVTAYSERAPERVRVESVEPLRRELDEFLRAVRGETAEIVSGEEGTRSMEVATSVLGLVESR